MFVAGGATPVAFDIRPEDCRMMDEPVDCGDHHARIGEHVVPAKERLVRRDEKATALVPFGDQFNNTLISA